VTTGGDERLEQLREVLPAGRERALAWLEALRKLILAHPDEFSDDGMAAALGGVDWMRKLVEAEYASEDGVP
jgi:hypothetical protein